MVGRAVRCRAPRGRITATGGSLVDGSGSQRCGHPHVGRRCLGSRAMSPTLVGGTPDRGSPGSQNKPLRAATRREALPVRRTSHFSRRTRRPSGRWALAQASSPASSRCAADSSCSDERRASGRRPGCSGAPGPPRRRGRRPPPAGVRRRSHRRRSRRAPGPPSPRSSSGPGGSATPAITRATWAVGAPGFVLPRGEHRGAVHPGPDDVEPPQAAGQRVRGRAGPDVGERLESLVVREVHEALGHRVVLGVRAPRTSSVAARSAASETSCGSAPPVNDSKNRAPGVIGLWCRRSLTGSA